MERSWHNLGEELPTYVYFAIMAVAEFLLLGIWALAQVGTTRIIKSVGLSGTDLIVVYLIQGLFTIAGLAVVCIYLITDIQLLWIYSRNRVDHARDNPNDHTNNDD